MEPSNTNAKQPDRLQRELAKLPSSNMWWFANGDDYITQHVGGGRFEHYRCRDSRRFGYSMIVSVGDNRFHVEHYNENETLIAWTTDEGRRIVAMGGEGGDKNWRLYRPYIALLRRGQSIP